MRYAIFSDVHSNLEALEAVLNAYKKEAIDRYLCIGDIVGYAGNPKECIERIKQDAIATVAGNHDWASADLYSCEYFNTLARQAITWTKLNLGEKDKDFLKDLKLTYKNKDLTMAHGTLDKPQDFDYLTDAYLAQESFKLLDTGICFVGHTHVPAIFIRDNSLGMHYLEESPIKINPQNRYIVNVGSVGQPRDGNPKAAYCIYDTKKHEIHIKRIIYNAELARKKIIEAGLPGLLGDRLLSGR